MNNLDENVVGFRIVTDNERLIVIHNATKESKMITIPSGLWKVYVGLKWRILLEISPDQQTALIVKVAPRRDAYR